MKPDEVPAVGEETGHTKPSRAQGYLVPAQAVPRENIISIGVNQKILAMVLDAERKCNTGCSQRNCL